MCYVAPMNTSWPETIDKDKSWPETIAKEKIKITFRLICASKVKKFALEFAKNQIRTKNHTRVSEEFLISCEIALKNYIISRVKMQPTKGKTLT